MTSRLPSQVVIAGYYPPPFGGESVHVWQLSAQLKSAGRLKGVVNLRRGAPQSPEYLNAAGPARFGRILSRLLSSETLLHLHTNGHAWTSWGMILCAAGALKIRGGVGVLTLHSGMSPEFLARRRALGAVVCRSALAAFAHIVCVNGEIRERLACLGVPRERLSVIPAYLGGGSGALGEADERLLQGFHPLVSVVAGDGPEYGLPVLLDGLAHLCERYPDMGCVIVGANGNGVAGRASHNGLKGRVRFVGPVSHDRCLAFLASSDVFVRPALADGDAVSVREALSLGIPVVASTAAQRPAGTILFRIGEPDDLARQVAGVLERSGSRPTAAASPDFASAILSIYERHRPGGGSA